MAKRTLGIAVTQDTFDKFHGALDKYNEHKELDDKYSMSKFIFELFALGFKLYNLHNQDFDKANLYIEKIINQLKAEQEKRSHVN